jgi:hypothetical protein
VWGVLGLIGCGWVLIWGLAGLTLSDSMPLFVMIILLNHGLLKFWIASEACYHLSEQRHSGALEYLLSCTPLSVREILSGQWEALRRRFFWPMIAVLVADVALMAVSFSPAARNDADDLAFFDSCVAAAMAMLLTDALAIGWLGMWRAMTEKKGHTAAGSTIIRIVILPWLILSLIGALAPSSLSKYFVLVLWLFLGIGIDIGYAGTAQQHLLTRFRAQAAVQPDESPGILGQLGRLLGKMTR